MLHAPYFQLYARQVVKQADLVLAMHWCPEAFTAEQKARNVDYYERITVRDSSLSACTQSVMCAEVGHLDLAHDYAREAALIDLQDLHANTGHGLHIASLAGAWSAIVEGFGGLRQHHDVLALAPRLPTGITRSDAPLSLLLYGEQIRVSADAPLVRPVVALEPLLPEPHQPAGRAPDVRYGRRQDASDDVG